MKRFFRALGLKSYLALVGLLGLCGAVAIGNYAVTVGSGTNFGSVIVGGVHYAQQFICDVVTPSQCANVSAGGAVSVTAAQATASNLNATVVQATGTNLHTVVDSGTITAVTSITNPVAATQSGNWTSRIVGNAGGVVDAVTGAAVPANAIAAGFSDGTNTVIPRVGAVANVAAATGMTQALGVAQYNATPLTVTDTRYQSLQADVNGFLKVNVAAGGASGGTSSTYGATFPATGTAVGFTDGTNMVAGRVGAVANVAAATNLLQVLGVAQYNATPLTVTDTRYQSLQSDVNGFLKVNVTNATALGAAADAGSNPVTISTSQAITGQNVASPTRFLNPCQFNTTPTTITTGNVSPFQCDSGGKLLVNPGTVTVTATNLSTNVAQFGGTNVVNGGVAGSQSIGGTVATNVAINANPVNLGAQAVSSENTAVTTARQVQLVADLVGKLIVLPYANPENFVSGTITSAMTGTTSTSLIAAPAAGLRNYITQCTVSNSHATVGTDMILQDGSGGTTLYVIPAAPAFGGATLTFPVPLRQPTTATALFIANVTTGANTKASCSGYKGA